MVPEPDYPIHTQEAFGLRHGFAGCQHSTCFHEWKLRSIHLGKQGRMMGRDDVAWVCFMVEGGGCAYCVAGSFQSFFHLSSGQPGEAARIPVL